MRKIPWDFTDLNPQPQIPSWASTSSELVHLLGAEQTLINTLNIGDVMDILSDFEIARIINPFVITDGKLDKTNNDCPHSYATKFIYPTIFLPKELQWNRLGEHYFNQLIPALEQRMGTISGVVDNWSHDLHHNANLDTINRLTHLPLEERIWHTFTGKMIQIHGYTRISYLYAKGLPQSYQHIVVVFTKPNHDVSKS